MIEFEDLTALDRDELINFYPVDWYIWMTKPNRISPAGFTVLEPYAEPEALFDKLSCGKVIKAMRDFHLDQVICLLRKGHQGECLCWTPYKGIISRL